MSKLHGEVLAASDTTQQFKCGNGHTIQACNSDNELLDLTDYACLVCMGRVTIGIDRSCLQFDHDHQSMTDSMIDGISLIPTTADDH